ncbi:MAG: S-layer homology domain-containing protein [Oscillospiraceae bacterium]|nr:S-layer homology domain-containing protein [Oscillospiraceae bacterium]
MKKSSKRIISFALCLVILIGFVPCLELQAEAAKICYVGDTIVPFNNRSERCNCSNDYCDLDKYVYSDESMIEWKSGKMIAAKAGTLEITAKCEGRNAGNSYDDVRYHTGNTVTIIIKERTVICDTVELYHDAPFCGGGIFPEIYAASDAHLTVTEANIYKEMTNYYPGDKLPSYSAGAELLCVIDLVAERGYTFPNVSGAQKCYVNGKEAKIYYNGEKASIYYDVVLESGTIGGIRVTNLRLPTHGKYIDREVTVSSSCTWNGIEYTLNGVKQEHFKFGDEIQIRVRVKCGENDSFKEGYTSYVLDDEGNIMLKSNKIEIISDHQAVYVFDYTVGATEDQYINKVGARLPLPVLGEPQSPIAVQDVGYYSAGSVNWNPTHDVFLPGVEYTATFELYSDASHLFSSGDIIATVNGEDVTPKLLTGEDGLPYLQLSYTFPALPEPEKPYVFPFIDVAENAWFYQWIKGAHQMGLINGKTATTYCPKDNMTYAEAIKLAACMHQLYHEGEVTLQNGKPDWRTSYYDYCLNNGIIRAAANAMEPGYADLFALASTPIDRQTYVYIFSRALPAEAFKEINNIPDNSIPDVPVTQGIWDDGIYLFYRAGILNGTDAKGTFNPEGSIQRSEVAAILNRMMDESVRVGAPAELGK